MPSGSTRPSSPLRFATSRRRRSTNLRREPDGRAEWPKPGRECLPPSFGGGTGPARSRPGSPRSLTSPDPQPLAVLHATHSSSNAVVLPWGRLCDRPRHRGHPPTRPSNGVPIRTEGPHARKPGWEVGTTDQNVSTILPRTPPPSSMRCACAASSAGKVCATRGVRTPSSTLRRSPSSASRSSATALTRMGK